MRPYFVYHQIMNVVRESDLDVSGIAAAIGEPARVRILYCLMDGHARTGTELATVAEVSPSTTSVHLSRLLEQRLIKMLKQGKHRYYSLEGPNVAAALESLDVLAGGARDRFVPNTPGRLRAARTCYDHVAGTLGVALHNRLQAMRWMTDDKTRADGAYDVTPAGAKAFAALGVDLAATRKLRRRFAYSCLDWSERQPHMGGALAAAMLQTLLQRKWLLQDLDSRALSITRTGRRELLARFGIEVDTSHA